MVETTRELGIYTSPDAPLEELCVRPASAQTPMGKIPSPLHRAPGRCVTWQEHLKDLGCDTVQGNPELAERVWNMVDSNAAMYIWQMLLSF
jgi:hypothetical protein